MKHIFRLLLFFIISMWFSYPVFAQTSFTAAGASDQDDMTIWVHPTDKSKSTIIASDKGANKLFVYDLSGTVVQTISTPGQPGNIDVRYGFPLDSQTVDIVALNNRGQNTILVYSVDPASRQLTRIDNGSISTSIVGTNYGGSLYKSPVSGKFYAVVTQNGGGKIAQYELSDDGAGKIKGTQVRTWQVGGQSEGVVADDENRTLFIAEEKAGIWKLGAEPTDPAPGAKITTVGQNGLTSDVEGVTLYKTGNGGGYLIASSQGSNNFKVYNRVSPYTFVTTYSTGTSSTDGVDVTNVNLTSSFPQGFFVSHNGGQPAVLKVVPWNSIAANASPSLTVDTSYNPRGAATDPTQTIQPTQPAGITLTPTVSISTTPGQNSCSRKSQGDADCDGNIDFVDYDYYRRLVLLDSSVSPNISADFNGDGETGVSDGAILIESLGLSSSPTGQPTGVPTAEPTIEPTNSQQPLGSGIWTSAQELANKTTSGPAWEVMFADAQKNTSNPCIHDQDDRTPNYVLAKAIVYARLSTDQSRLAEATRYKNEVVATLGKLTAMGYDGCPGNPSHAGGQKRTLAWARNLAAYIMAADLVNYQDPSFMAYINDVTNTWKDEHSFAGNNLTMREMFEYMPNNWAKWAFASLTALYRFQGNQVKLKELRTYFLGKINGPVPSGVGYYATTWHLNASNPVEINPKGAKKICPEYPGSGNMVEVVIDGLQPSEMRRAGECTKYPNQTGYAWEGMQGMVVGARILERAGMPIWEAGDKALCRAATAIMDRFAQQDSAWLPEESGNRGTGWMLVFLDKACSTNWVSLFNNQPEYKWGASRKSGGYGYILP